MVADATFRSGQLEFESWQLESEELAAKVCYFLRKFDVLLVSKKTDSRTENAVMVFVVWAMNNTITNIV